jgi:signal transduction histidine kinase/CheY-like chemotaxis protein
MGIRDEAGPPRAANVLLTDMFPLSIRSKLIVFSALPVLAVYAILLVLGVSHVYNRASLEAQDRLVAHASHEATRLALVLNRVPLLAASLGDLVLANPDQSQALLYAHLIDGLRRTPVAASASLVYDGGRRSAAMTRGDRSGKPAALPENADAPIRGWGPVGDNIRFYRPIVSEGDSVGLVWIDILRSTIDEILAGNRHADIALDLAPLDAPDQPLPLDEVREITDTSSAAPVWTVYTGLPDLPLVLRATIPVETVLAPVRQQVRQVIGALIASLLVIILIIGVVARAFTLPLRQLDRSVQEISRGHFDVDPAITSNDELGRLGHGVARMSHIIAEREQQLKKAQSALEERVEQRTRALRASNLRLQKQIAETRATGKALRIANAKAERASRAKSEFLSNVSHELRTPLHGVLGNTQILLRDIGTDRDTRTKLLAVERCGQHLLTLINQILDLAKIESGRPETRIQPTELRRLLDDTLLIVAQSADAKGLDLVFDAAADLPEHLATDRLKLKQILLNLLDNAIKFTNAGRVTLSVRRLGEDRVEFSVNDTGCGIAAGEIDKIFEPFHQSSSGRQVDGTGLGLAINRRLVALIGGSEIHMASTVDAGSRFWFDIPVRHDDTGDGAEAQTGARTVSPATRISAKTVNIMLLDNDVDDAPTIIEWLQRQDCDVDPCSRLPLAVARLQEASYDVVIVDLRLPGPQAYQWGTAIREASTNPELRLVGSSRDVSDQATHLLEDAGFDAFLQKPYTEQELLTAVLGEQPPGAIRKPLDAMRRFLPLAHWPEAYREAAAEAINEAVGVGDVDRLIQTAERLRGKAEAPVRDVLMLQRLIAGFDFDGIRGFAEELKAQATPAVAEQ